MKHIKRSIFVTLFCLTSGFAVVSLTTATPPICRARPVGAEAQLAEYFASKEELAQQAQDEEFLQRTFRHIKKLSKSIKKTTLEAKLQENIPRNRHTSFLPFDDARTCKHIEKFYVSASDVETTYQKYIITQGPLHHTVDDFWKMIIFKNCSCIVALAMDVEEEVDKCAPYWKGERLPHRFDDWTITASEEQVLCVSEEHPEQQLVRRRFFAKNAKSLESRVITQIHYENWPDNGVPNIDLFVKLLDIVDAQTKHTDTPICVHCSAGIGRSGTFVVAQSLRKQLRHSAPSQKLEVNIPKTIFTLRNQRHWIVGTWAQMQVIYKVLADEMYELARKPSARKERGRL
jgi:tyrosine-protein phosphatase non-receptor type 12/18/22